MKIEEPKTPYNYSDPEDQSVDQLDAESLAEKLKVAAQTERTVSSEDDEAEDDDDDEQAECESDEQKGDLWRLFLGSHCLKSVYSRVWCRDCIAWVIYSQTGKCGDLLSLQNCFCDFCAPRKMLSSF